MNCRYVSCRFRATENLAKYEISIDEVCLIPISEMRFRNEIHLFATPTARLMKKSTYKSL